MRKTVGQIVTGARIMLKRVSEQKLSSEDMRYLLHNVLDRYHLDAIKQNVEFYTDSEEVTFVYDPVADMYAITLTDSARTEFYPVWLKYQSIDADPLTDPWYQLNQVKIGQFPDEERKGYVAAAFVDSLSGGIRVRMNLTDEVVQERRWRLDYRWFPADVLGILDAVPFPSEFTSLLETALAADSIGLVNDSSQEWQMYKQTERPQIQMKQMQLERKFLDWVGTDVENIVVTPAAFHYNKRNPLRRKGVINFRTESG